MVVEAVLKVVVVVVNRKQNEKSFSKPKFLKVNHQECKEEARLGKNIYQKSKMQSILNDLFNSRYKKLVMKSQNRLEIVLNISK